MSRINARLRFRGSGLWTAPQPFNFRVHQVFKRFLPLALRVQVNLFRFQKRAVVSVHTQIAVFIRSCEFNDCSGYIFQKIAVMADHYTGESRVLQ